MICDRNFYLHDRLDIKIDSFAGSFMNKMYFTNTIISNCI